MHAAQTTNFNQVEILVENKGVDARTLALQAATQEMLVRLSGHVGVLENQIIIDALAAPTNPYVSQYDYQANVSVESRKLQPWKMIINFDTRALSNLLRQAKSSLWSFNRPSVLVWFVVEEGLKRRIVGAEDTSVFVGALKEHGDRRGLPVFLPLMDYEDEQAVTSTQLWAMYDDTIFMASSRYGAETVLVGRAYEISPGQWQGQWRLFFKGKVYPFNVEGAKPMAFMDAGVSHSAETLANFYAIDLSDMTTQEMVVQVHGINSLAHYADVTSYLSKLGAIKTVNLTSVQKDSLVFLIQTEGSIEQFSEIIKLDNRLTPIENPRFLNVTDPESLNMESDAGASPVSHFILVSTN